MRQRREWHQDVEGARRNSNARERVHWLSKAATRQISGEADTAADQPGWREKTATLKSVHSTMNNQETRVTWNLPMLVPSVRRRHRVQRFPYPVVYRDQRSARYREEELSPPEYRRRV